MMFEDVIQSPKRPAMVPPRRIFDVGRNPYGKSQFKGNQVMNRKGSFVVLCLPAAIDKPVKVFILMGQSNMLGFGRVGPEDKKGTLQYLTKKEGKYLHLVDDQGNWTQRKDVRNVHVMCGRDMKNEWLTVRGRHIGPDLQFGYIMGHILDEPVLILKSCIGNRSLGWDLLPPGSKQYDTDTTCAKEVLNKHYQRNRRAV